MLGRGHAGSLRRLRTLGRESEHQRDEERQNLVMPPERMVFGLSHALVGPLQASAWSHVLARSPDAPDAMPTGRSQFLRTASRLGGGESPL